jgi:hypothetical protein
LKAEAFLARCDKARRTGADSYRQRQERYLARKLAA